MVVPPTALFELYCMDGIFFLYSYSTSLQPMEMELSLMEVETGRSLYNPEFYVIAFFPIISTYRNLEVSL